MANLYVRSTDGNDTNAGLLWMTSKATIGGAAGADLAGDRIWVSQAHSETNAAAVTWFLAGTLANPVWVVAGNDAAEPPTAAATASFATTSGSPLVVNGNCYIKGITFNIGSGATNASFTANNGIADEAQTYEQCKFQIVATGSSSLLNIGASAAVYPCLFRFKNCDVKFANAGTGIAVQMGEFIWDGGSVVSGSVALTGGLLRFPAPGRYAKAFVSGVDLSNLGVGSFLVAAGGGNNIDAVFRNCKLPAGWTGTPVTGTLRARDRVAMYNCDNADTNYRLWIETYAGTVRDETTIVNGASSTWKMTSAANAEFPTIQLESPELWKRNSTVGSAITATVEVVTDGVTLTDDECWLEVQYLGTTGFPLALFSSDAKADIFATAAAQTTSSAAWTTTGLTVPVKQKLSVTFTPRKAGVLHAVVRVAKASTTVYVDQQLTIT